MSDTVEKLAELLGCYMPPTDRARCLPYQNGKCDGMCAECTARHLVENGVAVNGWIPVSERLPEEYEAVLCFDGTYVEFGDFLGGVFVEFDKYESNELCGVTHWMPLPEPPKGE